MREALAFLTVVGRPTTPTPRAWRWFPVVGAAIGAAVGSVWWLADRVFPTLLAAALTVAADLAITGLLHVDGLADAADGLLPHAPRERRLEIMRTPGIGAFGAAVLGVTLIVRTAALSARPADIALVVALWAASRTVVAAAPAWLPYARDDGLASPLLTTPASRLVALALVPAAAVAAVNLDVQRAAAHDRNVIIPLILAVVFVILALLQTVGLVVAGARW